MLSRREYATGKKHKSVGFLQVAECKLDNISDSAFSRGRLQCAIRGVNSTGLPLWNSGQTECWQMV